MKSLNLILCGALALGACSHNNDNNVASGDSIEAATAGSESVDSDSFHDMPNDGVNERTTGNELARVSAGTRARPDGRLPMIEVSPSHPVTPELVVVRLKVADCAEPQVHFPTDSAELSENDHVRLQILAECIATRDIEEVVVAGYTDPRGTEEYNRELSRSRAEAVASVLEDHGVVDAEVVIEPHGETDADESPSEWPADRRASVDVGQR